MPTLCMRFRFRENGRRLCRPMHCGHLTTRRTADKPGSTDEVCERSDLGKLHFPDRSRLIGLAEGIHHGGFSLLPGGARPRTFREVRAVAAPEFDRLARELLDQGLQVRFTVTGTSMSPFLEEGDVVTLAPVKPEELKIGDLALVRRSSGSLTLHRLVRKKRQPLRLLFKGDALTDADEPVTPDRVRGRVIEIQRAEKRLSLQGPLSTFVNRLLAEKSLLQAVCRRILGRAVLRLFYCPRRTRLPLTRQ